jgi:hypothetical protein
LIADRLLVYLNAGGPIEITYPPGAWRKVLAVDHSVIVLERAGV